ncbi:SOS response-associated peptidase [Polaromonas sp.]|uniref:SOS response-associated peptidase n=1 Tax=Polaromonas sp. TaxID=1869339 RepID=UPI003BACCB07
MSTQYESLKTATLYPDVFRVAAPVSPVERQVWPRQPGVFIRVTKTEETEDAQETADADKPPRALPSHELVAGQFGLVPRWVKSASDAKLRSTKLVNARSETVTTSSNFRDAWLAGQRCIVPMVAFMEDDWRSGKAVPTRIARVDGKPMGVAGLWESWTSADGETIVSYTLLTVNANSHALMSRYQQPGNEKRMLAILNEGAYDAWLGARHEKAKEFMRAYPANWLHANPVEKKPLGIIH